MSLRIPKGASGWGTETSATAVTGDRVRGQDNRNSTGQRSAPSVVPSGTGRWASK